MVTILSPLDLSTSDLGDPVTFTATAIDGQDGDLSASLAWVSSLDGPFGSGASFAYALSEGYHEITASVTDSSGLTGSATVRHTVLPPAPPISTIFVELSTDQPLYFDGQTVIVTVTATAGGAGGGGLQPVPGGTVRFAIVTPNQTVMQDWGVTDANGIYTYTYVVDTTAHGVGVYQMGAQVEHPAFGSGQNSGYYQVQ
ncbi:hypothetical protein IIA16_05590 [bacterium]|nr:hypothetical protein [bacterium]